jgi:hypothetical protein
VQRIFFCAGLRFLIVPDMISIGRTKRNANPTIARTAFASVSYTMGITGSQIGPDADPSSRLPVRDVPSINTTS